MKKKRAKRSKEAAAFPDMIALSRSGTKDRPYYSVYPMDFTGINHDTIVGVYKFKRLSEVKVTRTLNRSPKGS